MANERKARRDPRHTMAAGALIKTPQGMSFDATMEDISAHGCNLRLQSGFLEANHPVLIRLDGLESLIGMVRWVRDNLAGVEFERALHPAVAEHLANVNPKVTCSLAA